MNWTRRDNNFPFYPRADRHEIMKEGMKFIRISSNIDDVSSTFF